MTNSCIFCRKEMTFINSISICLNDDCGFYRSKYSNFDYRYASNETGKMHKDTINQIRRNKIQYKRDDRKSIS